MLQNHVHDKKQWNCPINPFTLHMCLMHSLKLKRLSGNKEWCMYSSILTNIYQLCMEIKFQIGNQCKFSQLETLSEVTIL